MTIYSVKIITKSKRAGDHLNILHMKYAFEVAKAGSLSKASEALLIAVPNISRSIKELEADLGITIFERTTKGMALTPEGEQFINFAKGILEQINQVESFYREGTPKKQRFSVSAPRACYVSDAFAEFSKSLSKGAAEIFYKETNSQQTIQNVVNHDYNLGIVRYAENYEKYFRSLFEEKGLCSEIITEFTDLIIMSAKNDLAQKEKITFNDLAGYIEVTYADSYAPSVPLSKLIKEELPDNIDRKIFIFERASQLELISKNHEAFMWVSPAPKSLLKQYDLVQRNCEENQKIYKDVLIYRKDYKLTSLDKQFIEELHKSQQKEL